MLGLDKNAVKLVEYDPGWPALYEEEKARLQAVLGDAVLDIQHVGSTSIPGCSAKPIIDIGICVKNFEAAFALVEPLVAIGYEYMGEYGIPRRHFFVKRNPQTTHHLHICEPDSHTWTGMILFRDFLRNHPEMVEKYVALKKSLAPKFAQDRESYTAAKAPLIEEILAKAKSGKK